MSRRSSSKNCEKAPYVPSRWSFDRRELPSMLSLRKQTNKKQWNVYRTRMEAEMLALADEMRSIDFSTLKNTVAVNRMYSIAKQLLDETKEFEEICKRHMVAGNGGIRVVWCHPIKFFLLEEHLREKYHNSVFKVDLHAQNPFLGYNSEECVFVEDFDKERFNLLSMISNVPVHVDNGERPILFTPREMVVISDKLACETYDKDTFELLRTYIKAEWWPSHSEETREDTEKVTEESQVI